MVGGKAVGVGRASAWFPKLSPRRRVAVAVVVACSLIYIGSVARWERHPKPVKLNQSSKTALAFLYKTVGRGVTNNEAVVKGRAAIVTCTKDQGELVTKFMRPVFTAIGNLFEFHKVIIVESNSGDNTLEKLKEWQAQASDQLQLIVWEGKESIAFWRNKYVEEVLQADPPFDYMVVVDSDMTKVSVDGIKDSLLNHRHLNWGAMTANGRRHMDKAYYDIIALRTEGLGWDPQRGNIGSSWSLPMGEVIRKYTVRIAESWPPLRVQSAFAGVGVYKVPALRGCSYCSWQCTDEEKSGGAAQPFLCEHVPLSDCISRRNGKGVFINPKMTADWHWGCSDCCGDAGLSCEQCVQTPCAPEFDNKTRGIVFPIV